MGKIKLNLASGAIVEKPLVSAFSASGNSYVVLDNEMNGSMGLPIILVCKYADNRLIKIEDTNEWQIVKEYLKNIIAGNKVEYISVPESIPADDIYYTQLTLPVQSFDVLKSSYTISSDTTPVVENTPIMDTPVSEPIPVASPEPIVNATPVVETQPVVNESVTTSEPAPTPIVEPTFVINNEQSINETQVVESTPVATPTPVVNETPIVNPAPVENPEPVVNDVVASTPTPEVNTTPVIEPTLEPVQDTMQTITNELNNINTSVLDTPVVDVTPTPAPVQTPTPSILTPEEPANMQTVEPTPVDSFVGINDITPVNPTPAVETPVANPTPVVDQALVNNPTEDLFKDQKETFMQACENMFDALVQKFQKELQKKNN